MRCFRCVVASLAIGVLAAAALVAQAHPNFAGTWLPDNEKTAALRAAMTGSSPGGGGLTASGAGGGNGMRAGGGGGGGATMSGGMSGGAPPPDLTVTQTAAALTTERALANGVQKYVYKLDGSESVNVNGRTTLKTKSRWDGAKLVTEGTQSTASDQGTITGTFKESRWIDKDGAMIVESERVFEGGGPTRSVQALIKKK